MLNHSSKLWKLMLIVLLFLPLTILSDMTDKVNQVIEGARYSKIDYTTRVDLNRYLYCMVYKDGFRQHGVYPILVKALEEKNTNVRICAVYLLEALKDSRAIALLENHQEKEKHPVIRQRAEQTIKNLNTLKKQGRLNFIEGKMTPRLKVKLLNTNERYRVKQPEKQSLRITDLYNIRQMIAKKGFVHLVIPSYGYQSFMETHGFKFGLRPSSLEVFNKKKKFWRIYTYSDGFGPICSNTYKHNGSMTNFQNYAVVKGCTHAFFFDKESETISRLSLEEYKNFEKNQPPQPSIHNINQQQWKELNQKEKEKFAGRCFHEAFSDVTRFLDSNDKIMVAAAKKGLRVFNEKGEIDFLDVPSGLYSSNIRSTSFQKNRLYIRYKETVDIFEADDSFKLLHRIKVPAPDKGKQHIFLFDQQYMYTVSDKSFSATRLLTDEIGAGAGKIENQASMDDQIIRMTQDEGNVYLMTFRGIGIWNKKSRELKFYRFLKPPPTGRYFGPRSYLKWRRKVGDFLLGGIQTGFIDFSSETLLLFDIKKKEYIKGFDGLDQLSQYTGYLILISGLKLPDIFEGQRYWLIKNGNDIDIISKENSDIEALFSIEDPPHWEWTANNNAFCVSYNFNSNSDTKTDCIPGSKGRRYLYNNMLLNTNDTDTKRKRYYVGTKLHNICFTGDTLWLYTNCGLFSYAIKTGKWRNHPVNNPQFISYSAFYNYNTDFMANTYGLFSKWSCLNLDTFRIANYNSFSASAIRISPCNGNTVIFIEHGRQKIFTFHFPTSKLRSTILKGRLGQVGFYKSHLLAAGEETLYILDKNLNVLKTNIIDRVKNHNGIEELLPRQLETDGNIAWLLYRYRLTRLNLDTGKQTHFELPKENMDRENRILVDEDCLWYINDTEIFRIDKTTGIPVIISENGTFRPYKIRRFYNLMRHGDYILLFSDNHIFRLHRDTLFLEKSCLPISGIVNSTRFQDMIYIVCWDDIYQIPLDILDKSFEVAELLWK